MRSLSISCLALMLSSAHSWTAQTQTRATTTTSFVRLSMASVPSDDDPCWQDLYDDDCSMSSAYSASFVAGKWVKSMPCASGLDEVGYVMFRLLPVF